MVSVTRFSDFVKSQQPSESTDDAFDWTKEKDEWISALDGLYHTLSDYLKEYVDAHLVRIRENFIEINEENIGVYQAKRICVDIGLREVTFTPIGTLLIGSKGRVDVEGLFGKSRLVLVNRNMNSFRDAIKINIRVVGESGEFKQPAPASPPERIDWVWRILGSPPSVNFIDLNKENFYEMLMEVSNG